MGKPTGFLEFPRQKSEPAPVSERLVNFHEFVPPLTDSKASLQGARCMDCGIPFCTSGCPIGNFIPDWNDLVFHDQWREALDRLHLTNNFPEWTGRLCPAPCEEACTLRINADAVGIKSIEHAIIDKGWHHGWVTPRPPARRSGHRVAVVGSGPAGLACAQQLARAGHQVTVFEKNQQPGGLLRYGIPDFKLEKTSIDRRLAQMNAEGVTFECGVMVGTLVQGPSVFSQHQRALPLDQLLRDFDAVVLSGGAEMPRDLPIPGRELPGVHFALEYLIGQNLADQNGRTAQSSRTNAKPPPHAAGKHVVVIGGGDTGSDCVGTAHRQHAASVTQLELLPKPPDTPNNPVWPYWPLRLRSSSSHEEGGARDWSVQTQSFVGHGKVKALKLARLNWQNGKMSIVPGSDYELPADLVLLAMGFTGPPQDLLASWSVPADARGNCKAPTDGSGAYQTATTKLFAAGDMRRGQSLVVWAIREGRQCARAVDAFLSGGKSILPL